MKWLLILVPVTLSGCSLADLREDLTSPLVMGKNKDVRALEICEKIWESYGGLEQWKSIKKTSLIYTDTWPSLFFRIKGPWPIESQKVAHNFWNRSFDSEMSFLNGPWIKQQWRFKQGKSMKVIQGKTVNTEDGKVSFYLPTYQYFTEFPYRLSEIPILKYGGDTLFQDQSYHLLLGTWQSIEPNTKYDQYIIWVNQKTYFIDYLSYTIREKGNSLAGTMNYSNFREVQGVIIPFKQHITFLPGDEVNVHHIEIEEAEITYK